MIPRRYLPAIVSVLIVVAFLNTGVFAGFSDTERSLNNSVQACTPKKWTSTTEFDFYDNATIVDLHTKESPGNVTLAEKESADSSLYALAGGGTNKFYRYYVHNNTWMIRANTPSAIGYGGSMAYDESRYIYAMRGAGTTNFWRFDTTTNTWSPRTSTPGNVGTGGFLRYYSDGMFYALQGGGTGTLWKYNPITDTWSTLTTTLPAIGTTTTDSASMVVYMGYIYVIRTGTTNTFIRVTLDGTAWTPMGTAKPYNLPGTGTSITHGQGEHLIVARGGNTREVYEYSITTNTWAKLGNTPKNNGLNVGSDLAYDNIRPFVTVGGNTNTLLKYNSTLRTWAVMANAPGPINYGGNLLYVSFTTGGYSPSGYMYSKVYDTGLLNAVYDSLFTNYTLPAGTSIVFKIRASNTRTWIPVPDDPVNGTWDLTGVPWTTVSGTSIASVSGQYVQWRVEMTTTVSTATPVLQEVRLYYRGF